MAKDVTGACLLKKKLKTTIPSKKQLSDIH